VRHFTAAIRPLLACGLASMLAACGQESTAPTITHPSSTAELAIDTSGSTSGLITTRMNSSRCVDFPSGGSKSGTAVALETCHGNSQTWTATSAGELRLPGSALCLADAGGAGKDGDQLIIWTCDGSDSQKWQLTTSAELRGINDKCVDLVNSDAEVGTALVLNSCNGQASQTWNAPTAAASSPATPTSPTPTEPAPAGVVINPGQSIQAVVNQYPAGTAFVLAAGTHTNQTVVPKSGDSFTGQTGAILDGGNTLSSAFDHGLAPFPSNVTIDHLVIQNYNAPAQVGAVNVGTTGTESASRWTVSNCEIRYNGGVGIRIGQYARVLSNNVHHNRQLGIGGVGDSVLVEGNEIAFNNYQKAYDFGWEAGGTKFVLTNNLIVRGNYVHDNWGPGLWTDIDNVNALIENNRVIDNADAGIFHEISWRAVIRNNEVRNNGSASPRGWLWGAGIQIAASKDVEVYGNTLSGNANGIALLQQNRGSGTQGVHLVQNDFVHDNVVDMSAGGASGAVQDVGDLAIFTSRNNRFANNTYVLGTNKSVFAWMNNWLTPLQWQGYGQDLTGVFR